MFRTNRHFFPYEFSQNREYEKCRKTNQLNWIYVVLILYRQSIEVFSEKISPDIEQFIPWNWSSTDPEHRLAYFREDYGLNSFHWHWHLSFPSFGGIDSINKSRRGELFYYIHQQIVARYNFERLCNNLSLSIALNNWDEPIEESYFSKLDLTVAGRTWPNRSADLKMQDVHDGNTTITIDSLQSYRKRLAKAIQAGYAIGKDGRHTVFDIANGIDILGNMVESSDLSVDRDYYGQLHNFGHKILGHIHDPFGILTKNVGVMGNMSTSMRDPIFYRWHTFINEMFREYQNNLPGYTEDELILDGVTVDDVAICSTNDCDGTISTYWETLLVNLTRGLDMQANSPRLLQLTQLQHNPFTYRLKITSDRDQEVTIRIFLSPKYDHKGNPWTFTNQKNMFIEMDKFQVNLQQGYNNINRSFENSSVTIPMERTYRDLDTHRPQKREALDEFIFCGCGWPANLLVPRGTCDAFPSQLFVMVTDASRDKFNQAVMILCSEAHSYCGIRNSEYPDQKPMGFPFDRPPRVGVDTLDAFVTPNMKVTDVFIKLLSNDTYC